MGLCRNGLGLLIVAGCGFPALGAVSDAEIEVYPKRPITWVVGAAPGDAADVVARLLTTLMARELGQEIIIANRPGATGNVGAASVAKVAPDGYTVYMAMRPVALHKVMFRQIKYDFAKDFVPVGMIARIPFVLVAGNHVGVTTLPEAIGKARATPGKYTCASGGLGSTSHLICEALKDQASLPWAHIPYSGSVASLIDMLGGRTDFALATVTAALPLITSGRIRALAVFSDGRVPAIPDVPDIKEFGFSDMSAHGWCALVAPTGTPSHAIARLNKSLNTALSNDSVRKKFADLGYIQPSPVNTPDMLETFLVADTEIWTRVLEQTQIRGLQ
ncbi:MULTISPECIES: tripartite tricarboxylate transporter substrate binding protein [unclassified Achromobacter]|uniref:Bug family tripartite tricarboxylate transporter substrate binding protein n=1 Tax=unclassified Achromobacter TaxID=2626865 RepID=UPI001302FE05|nr:MULTISPECIES: tripartite tricarboxylate transporter substrate binding protein [unclassified Achromobacter]